MRKSDALKDVYQEGIVPESFNFSHAQAEAWTVKQRPLGGISGRFGCAAAHFRAQTHALQARPRKPLSVIFEDDSYPQMDFIPLLWSLVKEELPCDWAVVSLMSRCPYGRCVSPHLTRVQPDGN